MLQALQACMACQLTVCHVTVGLRNRANGSNTVNEHSSRSHSVLTLNIDSEIYDEEDDKLCMTRHGKLAFVDLAGFLRTIILLIKW